MSVVSGTPESDTGDISIESESTYNPCDEGGRRENSEPSAPTEKGTQSCIEMTKPEVVQGRIGCPECVRRWSAENTPKSSPSATKGSLCSKLPAFTVCDVAQHNKADDCWLIAHRLVYDATSFVPRHPAGEMAIVTHAGKECTEDFDFHSSVAQRMWKEFAIGRIVPCNYFSRRSASVCSVQ